jgi:hypothetical protein
VNDSIEQDATCTAGEKDSWKLERKKGAKLRDADDGLNREGGSSLLMHVVDVTGSWIPKLNSSQVGRKSCHHKAS